MTDPNADTGAGGGTPPTPSPDKSGGASDNPNPNPAGPAGGGDPDPGDGGNPPAAGAFKIPDEYAKEPWAEKIKNSEDLWKQVANLQKLAGKKAVVPDLKDEKQRAEFYAQLRPADKAEFTEALGLPETVPAEQKEFFGELLHETGATPEVSKAVIDKFTAKIESQQDELTSEEGYKAEMEKSFGKNYEKETGEIINLMKEFLSPEDVALLNGVKPDPDKEGDKGTRGIPNVYLGPFYRMVKAMKEQYGIQDTGKAATEPAGGIDNSKDLDTQIKEARAERQALMKKPHTSEQARVAQKKIDDLYTRKGKANDKK